MKVKKSTKKQTPPHRDVACVIERITNASDQELLNTLQDFPVWHYPRGDLHAWTGVLDKFDTILAETITSYDLTKIQTNDFTPKTKGLVLEILRVINLLLGNCTNRKLFASYDRLYDLLLTTDLDILQAALYVLLRPAQQYASQTPYERVLGRKISARLLTLARGVDAVRARGIELKTMVTHDTVISPGDTANLTISFYPTTSVASSQSPGKSTKSLPQKSPKIGAESATILELGNVLETMSPDMPDRLAELAEKHGMSIEDQYETQNKVRWLLALSDKATRGKLVAIRLLAIAVYAFLTADDAAQSSIFLYEPDLISQIAELVSTNKGISESVQAAALFALDAVAHHRSKLSETLTGLGANLNHGILMSQFREVVDKLVSGKPVLHELVDGVLTFIAFISTSPGHGHMLIGAGIIPILLDMLRTRSDRRDNYIPRGTGLIDAVVLSHAQSLPLFSNVDGVNTLVSRVRAEIEQHLESIAPEPTETLSEDTIIFYQTNPLKAVLRSVHRLMQTSGGTEGLRNLVDSDLPKSLKRIFENHKRFGPRVFALAINVMATFVHNEPTSLTILQEQQLPQTLVGVLETEIPPSFDVMATIPNAIGAICLNQTGLEYITSHPTVLINLINVAAAETSPDGPDKDTSQQIGGALDELARHHPDLKPIILKAMMDLLHKAIENGKSFVPPTEALCDYSLQALANTSTKTDDSKVPSNEPLTALTRIFKIFDGLLRNAALTKDFIKEEGVRLLISASDLPCIPLRFGSTNASIALSNLLRVVGDTDHVQLSDAIILSIQEVLGQTTALWKDENAPANWITLQKREADAALIEQFERLPGLSIRLAYLSEAFVGLAWSHSRVATSLIRSLGVTSGSTFVPDLAKLHRVCFREHARIAPQITAQQKTPTPLTAAPSTVIGIDDVDSIPTPSESESSLNLAAQLMTTRLHAVSTRTFKTAIKLLFAKRSPDAAHRKEADALATCISQILIEHLTEQEGEKSVDTDTVAVGLATLLLFDDRGHEGRLNTILFLKFENMGGVKALLEAIERIITHMDEITKSSVDQRTEDQKKDIVRTTAGIRISFLVMVALVQPMSLLENPQTHALQQRADASEAWEPLDTFLQLRLDILPLVHRVWTASWLPESPVPIIKHATKGFLTIMEGKNEDASRLPTITPATYVNPPAPRPPAVADPARVEQLVDMGFSRGSAEFALIRTRNNVAAATELILTMPHLFQDIVDPPSPAPAEEGQAEAPGAETEQSEQQPAPDVPQAAPDGPAGENPEAEFAQMVGSAMDVISAAFGIEIPQSGPETAASGSGGDPDAVGEASSTETTAPTSEPAVQTEEGEAAMEIDSEPTVPLSEQLSSLRSEYKAGVAARALVLLDSAQDLVFDLLPAFPSGKQGSDFLLEKTLETVKSTAEDREKHLAARLRMLAVYIRQVEEVSFDEAALKTVVDIVLPLATEQSPRPSWTCALQLFAEASFAVSEVINSVKIGDEPSSVVMNISTTLECIIQPLTDLSTTMLADEKATRDELLSSLRLLVVVTRRQPQLLTTELTQRVLAPFAHPSPNLHGCQPYIAMILRHAFEDHETLSDVMRSEIRQYLTPTRNKVTDVNHFVRQLRQVAARDPGLFVEAVEKECSLIDPSPPQSVYHIRTKDAKKDEAAPADPFRDHDEGRKAPPMVDILLTELNKAINQPKSESQSSEPSTSTTEPAAETEDGEKQKEADANKPKDKDQSQAYIGLIISVLTEVLGSYMPAKRVFMTAVRKHGLNEKTPHKHGLAALINDVICGVDLSNDLVGDEAKSSPGSAKRIALSSWTSSMLVALCADVGLSADHKEVPEDLTSVRKTVLDAIGKAIKDVPASEPSSRYGRLWALGELIYRLLLSKPSIPNQPTDGSSAHIAKIMLEKNFVSLLTAATGEVDLNFPGVRVVLGSLLRAMEHLTKISIKWSKGEKAKNEKLLPASASEPSSGSEGSDVDMDDMSEDEHDTAPDLYRNSALGMLGGDIRDDDSDDDDDEDEDDDDMMDAYGDEIMDEIMDDDSQTEPSDADDDGSEGSGEEDWTDEEMEDGEGVDDEGPEVVIGEPRPEEEEEWDDEVDDHETLMTDEEEEMMEMGFDDGGMFDDNPEAGDEDDMEEEEDYDELDLLDALPTADQGIGFSSPPEISGHWGWEQSNGESSQSASDPLQRMSRLMDPDGAAAALFGAPSRRSPVTTPAQPPLIAQPTPASVSRRGPRGMSNLGELFAALEEMGGPQAVQMMETLLARSGRNTEAIRISFAQGDNGQIDLSIGNRSFHVPAHGARQGENRAAEDVAAECVPKPTLHRWNEEMKITPIQSKDFAGILTIHIINRLLPEAKRRYDEDVERAKKEEEERAQREAEEQKKEAEEAARVPLPESRATPVPPEEPVVARNEDIEMVEDGQSTEAAPEPMDSAGVMGSSEAVDSVAQPAASLANDIQSAFSAAAATLTNSEADGVSPAIGVPAPEPAEITVPETLARTVVMVHGREVDITDTGIDLEFLQALPDDMRADVIDQHMREHQRVRRRPAPEVNPPQTAQSSSISPEFLDALPPDIRAEVIMQEAMENARRNRPRSGADQHEPPRNRDADPLSNTARILAEGGMPTGFLARLDDDLRDMMLLGPTGGPSGVGVSSFRMRGSAPDPATTAKRATRESIQLLEKPGIASLVRLLFFPESFKKTHLFRILANLCENSATRSDLLNLLLSVVQDGSGDLPLVDRSFQQMSLRAMTTPKSTAKAKPAESPAPISVAGLFAHLQTDNIPTFIAQRCLEALTHIVGSNSHAVNFFLTEHEQGVGLKKMSTKKGKGKEKLLPQTKFPIVILLGLLDRPALLSTAGMMESLTALLATITRPLTTLKTEEEGEKKEGDKKTASDTQVATTGFHQPAETETSAETRTPAPPTALAVSSKPQPAVEPSSRNGITKPPVVPASVLRLVVNCLTTGECSSKNFSQTLIVMQNLCYIPEAKETLLQELRDRSQNLGGLLRDELHTLATSLNDEKFEATSPALTVFSSPTSNQAQLLRLLKTIEYLHLSKVDSDPPGDVMTEKEEQVSKIYASFDFDSMWTQLRQCLSLVEAREDTEQISLILLPLVEALMVVCKYRRSPAREVRSPSAPPLSAVSDTGDLFLSFTTVHRKVLNTIVRNNPALLGGSFSLLIRNSRVLEFDNKRQWFFQKLKRKRDQIVPSGVLHLNVRRQYVFEDSFRALQPRSGDEIKYGKLGVKFHNEDGVDAGGVSREWYSVLAQQIFDPNFALFEPCAADKQTYQPNKHSSVNGDHLAYFKFIGRIIGKAVYDGRLLDAYFSRAFYKQILGRTVDMRDLESIDPEYHKSLQWMLDNDITGVIDQEFTIEDDQFGEKKIVELKEGGATIPVTEENKEEYVRLVVSYRLDNSIKDQNKAFLEGFYDIIPRQLIQIFEPDQLELLISGITTVDIDELKNATQMSGWKSSDPEVAWFWRALRSFSQEERSRFLMFVTSSSRVPLGGFTQLQGASGIQPFQMQKLYAKEGSLPQASTCFNLLLLPKYASYEQLRERLQFAVTETGGFGKA